jgi:hypothetical protein
MVDRARVLGVVPFGCERDAFRRGIAVGHCDVGSLAGHGDRVADDGRDACRPLAVGLRELAGRGAVIAQDAACGLMKRSASSTLPVRRGVHSISGSRRGAARTSSSEAVGAIPNAS